MLDGNGAPVTLPLFGDKTRGETEQTIVGLDLSWNFSNGMTLRSITGYVGITDYMHTDFSGDFARPPSFGAFGVTDVDTDQFTQEIQLLGTAFNDRLSYLLGAFYLTEDGTQPFNWAFGIVPGGNPAAALSVSLIDTEVDSFSVFGDATYQFTDNLSGTVGLRYTDDSKDFVYDFLGLVGPPFGPPIGPLNCTGSLDPTRCVLAADDEEWTPRFVLDYAFGESGVLVYGSAAKGFKGGGFSATAIFSTDPIGVYGPETNWTYEAGMKATWLGDRLRTNLAYFFSDIEDVQQSSTDATQPFVLEFPVENSGDAEIQGFEFELTAVPVNGLNIFLSGSLMDGEYTSLTPSSAAFASKVIYYGDPNAEPQTPQTPDYMVNIGFDYTFDFPTDVLGDFSFGFDYYEIDNYVTAATNDFHNSGWDQWNGFVSLYIAENWQLQFTGKNLGDDVNHTSGSRGLGGGIYLPPRTFLFTVTYRM